MNETAIIILLVIQLIIIIGLFLIYLKLRKVESKKIEESLFEGISEIFEKNEKFILDEFSSNRRESSTLAKSQREEVSNSVRLFGDHLFKRMSDISDMQKKQLDTFADQLLKLTQSNEQKFDKLQEKVDEKLKQIEENNSRKLEEMRATVDEKLHSTLEKRLGESFKIVSERLELVHKGLGEMQTLAIGVGDLKKVLSNVKTRGTWGEIQLETLIEQILTQEQYAKNVATKKGSNDVVEVAIKMPGRGEMKDDIVWIPIDAKFPLELYQRLIDASETANPVAVAAASKALEARIKQEAKIISSKYIDPPHTTDFAFMFLPIEGLYAEVLRIPGLFEFIQREYRVTVAGPTNFLAVLNSLQLGFKTLAIEKRSSEVWKLLGIIKTEFNKFGDILQKTQYKLDQASRSIGDAAKKTRTIERKLRDVEELPVNKELKLLDDFEE